MRPRALLNMKGVGGGAASALKISTHPSHVRRLKENYGPGCAAPDTAAPVKPGPTAPGASCTHSRLMMYVPPAPLVCTSTVVAALFAELNTGMYGELSATLTSSN